MIIPLHLFLSREPFWEFRANNVEYFSIDVMRLCKSCFSSPCPVSVHHRMAFFNNSNIGSLLGHCLRRVFHDLYSWLLCSSMEFV